MKGIADNETGIALSVHVSDVMELAVTVDHYPSLDYGRHEFWSVRIGPTTYMVKGDIDALHAFLGRINVAFATPREAGS